MDDDSNQSLLHRLKTLVQRKTHLGRALDLTEEIHGLMNEGQAKGLISDEESDMVQGVLDLKETTAHSIMIPRTEMSSASINTTVREVITLITEGGHTRIPIYKDNLDEIMGVLHAKDILKLWGQDPDTKIPIKFLRKPCFVPENQKISDIKTRLAELSEENERLNNEKKSLETKIAWQDVEKEELEKRLSVSNEKGDAGNLKIKTS